MATIVYDPSGNAYELSLLANGQLNATLVILPPAPARSGVTGWTVSQIVQQVMGRTENRASKKPNFDPRMEFFLGLDEFCQEKHYWWRRKMFSFQTTIGQQNYDLSQLTTGNAPDLAEVEEMFVVNAAPQFWPYSVPPAFNPSQQVGAVYGQPNIGQAIPRSAYFISPGNWQLFTLTNPPVQVYTVAGTYYAVPMVTDVAQDGIPLVPPSLHFGLVYMLERRIYEFLYGQNDPRWTVSNKRYEDFLIKAAKSKSFSSQLAISASTGSPAVHSTGGRGYNGGCR